MNNFRKAIKDFNKAIELRPNFSEAYCRKAACYQEMKKEEEALIEYKHAIEINDLHSKKMLFQAALFVSSYYKKRNNFEEALPYILKCAEYDQDNEVAQFNAGIAQMKLKKYNEAINYFNISLKINRANVHAMFNKAICLMNLEQYDEAILIFSLLIQMNKKDFESHLYKGICLKKSGKLNDAINAFTKLISISENCAPAYLHRGICYTNLKIFGKAINDFIKYSKNKKSENQEITDEDFYYHRSLCYINSNNIEDAINDLNKVIEINNNKANAYFKLGFCYLLRKDQKNIVQNLEKAISEFDKAIYLDKKYRSIF